MERCFSRSLRIGLLSFLWLAWGHPVPAGLAFRVGSYNVENYLLEPQGNRPVKTAEARAAVRDMILASGADVLALQEIGGRAALEDLRSALASAGHPYPHALLVPGHDPYIQVAVLSRFPLGPHLGRTNASFLLHGRRFFVSRAFLETEVEVSSSVHFRLICAHLKSRRAVPEADEAEMREQEALLLHEHIEALLRADPRLHLVVAGDLNDTHDARSIRSLIGRGGPGLIDTRPAERDPSRGVDIRASPGERAVTWTHHYGREDSYSRIDYILISRAMAGGWDRGGSFVLAHPAWGTASDHRPVVGAFEFGSTGRAHH